MTSLPHASSVGPSGLQIVPDMPICQQDLPLDWYQDEFKSYAQEYLALPDRTPATWSDRATSPVQTSMSLRV